jgi:cytochrome c biogenesis protein CcmG, thiol:disulfide interchange protein DsbE
MKSKFEIGRIWMKRIIKRVLMMYLLLFAFSSYSQSGDTAKYIMNADSFALAIEKKNSEFIGRLFPRFSVSAHGKLISNQTLQGKVVFMNFWFKACPPCMAEMEELNELFRKFGRNKNFEFVSFTFEDLQGINIVKKKYHILYHVCSISRDECYRLNNNNGFPTSVILDSTGIVKYVHPGDQLNKVWIKKYFTTEVYPLILREL